MRLLGCQSAVIYSAQAYGFPFVGLRKLLCPRKNTHKQWWLVKPWLVKLSFFLFASQKEAHLLLGIHCPECLSTESRYCKNILPVLSLTLTYCYFGSCEFDLTLVLDVKVLCWNSVKVMGLLELPTPLPLWQDGHLLCVGALCVQMCEDTHIICRSTSAYPFFLDCEWCFLDCRA